MKPILTVNDLEDQLSRPTAAVLNTLRAVDGDVMLLGAGGKIGPTLARMVRRGFDQIGQKHRRVIAVSRFSSAGAAKKLRQHGVETISCDLLDRAAVALLPQSANILLMAGQKFGTINEPELTWAVNTLIPAHVAERFSKSRHVVFSTGCVYPLVFANGAGAREDDALGPPGEYANSCVGRERIFTYLAKQHGISALFFRLCYAIDLRYGVLSDIAMKVAEGCPVDVRMGLANVIWQGDANARAIQCLEHTESPPTALNVTGSERVSIRWLAGRFGELLGCDPIISGSEGATAWAWDARRSYELFGPPEVSLDEMIEAIANWVARGGETLGRPTHFDSTDGRF